MEVLIQDQMGMSQKTKNDEEENVVQIELIEPQKHVPDVREMVRVKPRRERWKDCDGESNCSGGYSTVCQGHDDWGYVDCGEGREACPRACREILQSATNDSSRH